MPLPRLLLPMMLLLLLLLPLPPPRAVFSGGVPVGVGGVTTCPPP